MSENTENSMPFQAEMDQSERDKLVSDLLGDKSARDLVIEKLKEGDHVEKEPVTTGAGGYVFPMPSGNNAGSGTWPAFLMQFPFAPFPPFWGPVNQSVAATVTSREHVQPLLGSASSQGQPGSSSVQGQVEEDKDEDVVDLLDDAKSLELVQFDPMVGDDNAWEAREAITTFLEKHFSRIITPEEQEAIVKDFPKPACQVLQVPRLDYEIKKAGKDPHFGAERSLYKLQDQFLDMAGPLTCHVWADMMNKNAEVKSQEVILLIQRVLVLLGSTFQSIIQERRRVAWSCINPTTVDLCID